MDPSKLGYINVILSAITMLLMGCVLPLWRYVRQLRDNDMRHIEDRLERIEQKLDQHMVWHATEKES